MDSELKRPITQSAWQIAAGVQIADARTALEIVRGDDQPLPTIPLVE
jgi:hypothetical protein